MTHADFLDNDIDYEDPLSIFYNSWKNFSTGHLLQMRYSLGVELRSTFPRPAFPSYVFRQVRVINRILGERQQ